MPFDMFQSIFSVRSRGVFGNKIRAVVIANQDPDDPNRGRIRARARDIHDNFPDDHIPWSLPEEGNGAGTSGMGKVDVPPIGTTVFITHQDNSLYHPQYSHGPATDDRPVKALGPDKPGSVDRGGNLKMHDHSGGNNKEVQTHQSGTGFSIDTDGSFLQNLVKKSVMNFFDDNPVFNFKTGVTFNAESITFKCTSFVAPDPAPPGPRDKMPDKPAALDKPKFNKPSGTKY